MEPPGDTAVAKDQEERKAARRLVKGQSCSLLSYAMGKEKRRGGESPRLSRSREDDPALLAHLYTPTEEQLTAQRLAAPVRELEVDPGVTADSTQGWLLGEGYGRAVG